MGCLRVIATAEIIPVEPDKVMLDWGMSFLAFRPFMRYLYKGVFYLLLLSGQGNKVRHCERSEAIPAIEDGAACICGHTPIFGIATVAMLPRKDDLISVMLSVKRNPLGRSPPFCRFATFFPFHRGHLPRNNGRSGYMVVRTPIIGIATPRKRARNDVIKILQAQNDK